MDYKNENNENNKELEVKEAVRKYKPDGRFTYADYEKWDDLDSNGNPIRYELIDGIAYLMSAPNIAHQRLSMDLSIQFGIFLKGKSCEAFAAPFDVCLFGKGDDDDTVVQPDIVIICDSSKLEDGKKCNGAPDMTVEILSPSTTGRDRLLKLDKYLRAGVKEYWIIDPEYKGVTVNILETGKYYVNTYVGAVEIPVAILPGCVIKMPEEFAD